MATMIRYDLRCRQGHDFDSWFSSSSGFETLRAAGHLSCPICGGTEIDKALMAPALGRAAEMPGPAPAGAAIPSFAAEARAMHEGLVPERSIYGEARIDEAKKLLEDGIPVAPLPFLPKVKAN